MNASRLHGTDLPSTSEAAPIEVCSRNRSFWFSDEALKALLLLGWKSASGLMVCCIEPIVKAPRLLPDKASYRFIPLRRGCKSSMDEADA